QRLARFLEARGRVLERHALRQRARLERRGLDLVLALQPLERAIQLGTRLHAVQLQLVQSLAQLRLLEATIAGLVVEALHLLLERVEATLQLHHAVALRALGLQQPREPSLETRDLGREAGDARAVL